MLHFKNSLQQLNWLAVVNNDDANESYEPSQVPLLLPLNDPFPLQTKNIS